MLHQTAHRKRLLTAYTSRNNPLELAWRTPILQHWRFLGPDIIDQPLPEIAPTIFFDLNLRYIVLDYWQMPPGPERDNTEKWVAAALPQAVPIYDDGRLKVYQSPPKKETVPYLSLGQGWQDRQSSFNELSSSNELITRHFAAHQHPELFVHHPQDQPLILEITAATQPQNKKSLTLFMDNKAIDTIQIGPNYSKQTFTLPPSKKTLLKLRLAADNPDGYISVSRISLRTGETN